MAESNPNARLEAFCDGVFAIALTLLILEIRLPAGAEVSTTAGFWLALRHMTPSVLSFVLSFIVIFISWVNHHGALRLIAKSSTAFIYANGLLLLTVVFIPFPTALLGAHLFTDHAAPAVVLYEAVLALQAVAWILLSRAAVAGRLTRNDAGTRPLLERGRYGYFALGLYTLCAVLACWFPLVIAIVTWAIWLFWVYLGFAMHQD